MNWINIKQSAKCNNTWTLSRSFRVRQQNTSSFRTSAVDFYSPNKSEFEVWQIISIRAECPDQLLLKDRFMFLLVRIESVQIPSPVHLFTCSPVYLFTCSPVHLLTCSTSGSAEALYDDKTGFQTCFQKHIKKKINKPEITRARSVCWACAASCTSDQLWVSFTAGLHHM